MKTYPANLNQFARNRELTITQRILLKAIFVANHCHKLTDHWKDAGSCANLAYPARKRRYRH